MGKNFKKFPKVSHFTKSFPPSGNPLTIDMIVITIDTVGMKHGFCKSVKMRNDFMVKKKFPTLEGKLLQIILVIFWVFASDYNASICLCIKFYVLLLVCLKQTLS